MGNRLLGGGSATVGGRKDWTLGSAFQGREFVSFENHNPVQSVRMIHIPVGRQSRKLYARSSPGPSSSPEGPAGDLKFLGEVLHRTLGFHAQSPSGQPQPLASSEVIEWDVVVIICIQQNFCWRLTDDSLRGHRRRHLRSHIAEVSRTPRSVSRTVKIRCPLERKDDAVDQDGNQANCHRHQ